MSKKSIDNREVADLGITTLIWILCIAPIVLLGLLIAILVKILSLPVCTAVGQNACSIDGWSLAGIAGSVLGIGAALLTILVGLAAVAWLVKLDRRIDRRVEARVSERMEEMRQKQEEALTRHFDEDFQKRWKIFDEALIRTREEINIFNNNISVLQDIAMRPDLEDAEAIANDWWDTHWNPWVTQRLALHLIHRYEKKIEGLTNPAMQIDNATVTPKKLLTLATAWEKKLEALDRQKNPPGLEISKQDAGIKSNFIIAAETIRRITPYVEDWEAQHTDPDKAKSEDDE